MVRRTHPEPTRRKPPPEKKKTHPESLPARVRRPGPCGPKTVSYYHIPRERPKLRPGDVGLALLLVAVLATMVWSLGVCRSLGYSAGHAAGYDEGWEAALSVQAAQPPR